MIVAAAAAAAAGAREWAARRRPDGSRRMCQALRRRRNDIIKTKLASSTCVNYRATLPCTDVIGRRRHPQTGCSPVAWSAASSCSNQQLSYFTVSVNRHKVVAAGPRIFFPVHMKKLHYAGGMSSGSSAQLQPKQEMGMKLAKLRATSHSAY